MSDAIDRALVSILAQRAKASIHPAPKPKPTPPAKRQYSSIVDRRTHSEKIAASHRLRSTTPPKRKNAKRAKSEFARAYGSAERVEWVKAQECVVRGVIGHGGTIENVHTMTGGGSRKADARFIVPMCKEHHRELHTFGKQTFEFKYLVPLDDRAARTELAWRESENAKMGGR